MTRRLFLLSVLMAAACSPVVAQGVLDPKRYTALNERILFDCPHRQPERTGPPDNETGILKELHDMVTTAIQRALKVPTVSPDSIEQIISELQGPCSLWGRSSNDSDVNIPFADSSTVHGVRTLLAAFAVVEGGWTFPDVRPYLQFYSFSDGQWKLRAEIGSEFNDELFSITKATSPVPNEIWYLVSGTMMSNTCSQGTAALYGFDSKTVRTIWTRDECGLAVSMSGERLTLSYRKFHENGQLTEVLRITENGLVTESLEKKPDAK